jgi:hypothetical protein
MTQQPMFGRPARPGRPNLLARVLDGQGNVHDGAWRAAMIAREPVGTCPAGGDHLLRPGDPYRQGLVWWYPAECGRQDCDYETAAHGARPAANGKGKG